MKKRIRGERGDDPDWIKQLAENVLSGEVDEDDELIRELFLEYFQKDGMKPAQALEKAKKVAASFKKGN